MKRRTHKNLKLTYIKTTLFILFVCLLFIRGYIPFESTGENTFHIYLNGHNVGTLADKSLAEPLLMQARKNIVSASEELMFLETQLEIIGEELVVAAVDSEEDVLASMESVLAEALQESVLRRSYTVKINEYIINLANLSDVKALLQAAVAKYDTENEFTVELSQDAEREFNVLKTDVVKNSRVPETKEQSYNQAGIQDFISELTGEVEQEKEGFEDYELGIREINFYEDVEVAEVYLPADQLTGLEEAISLVTKEQEEPAIYTVVPGDTLYEIAINVNIPIDKIVEMNKELLPTSESTLHIGDELTITVPEPELSVTRVEECYYEETYEAEVVYIMNDSWYENKSVVHQQPSAGFRKVIAEVTYLNDKEVSRTIIKEEIAKEAVPKIVERGTRIVPTFIRPLTGGRITSNFGYRKAPTAGASTNHKGVDIATPTGTSIVASCGGTVTKAGWASGYGYVVYISHDGGVETRYAHLSKVLVSVGDKVKQGEKIALSGNTGVSTGPHLHFEMRVYGTPVDPFSKVGK